MAKSYSFNPFTGNFDLISEVSLTAVGSSPSANGASISSSQALTLQPADATHPGVLTALAQSIGGAKTFSGSILANGGIDVTATGGTDTLNFGVSNADVINIGNTGAAINLYGTTFYQDVTNLQVTDKLITVNKGGAAASGFGAGIEIEENSIITAYADTSSDRNSWEFKAPNTAGVAVVTPGAGGITLNQSSHNPVTLGTANGLSLATQVLSLGLSSTSTTGALSSTDWNTFNGKQAAGNYITALTGDASASGPGSAALTFATVNSNVGSFGSASSVGTFTVNGKGLVTAAGSTSIQIAESQVTNLVSDLAGKQATGNYITALTGDVTASGPGSVAATLATVNSNTGTFGSSTLVPIITVNGKGLITAVSTSSFSAAASALTGTTLAANVVSSSLTSVGTISSGTWQGTAVDATHGGTSQTSWTSGDLLYASATNTLSKRAIGTSDQILAVSSGVPTWRSATFVAARYQSTGGTSINATSFGTIVFNVSSFQTPASMLNVTNGVITIPFTGYYEFLGYLRWGNSQAWTQGNIIAHQLLVNGSTAILLGSYNIPTTYTPANGISTQFASGTSLNAGDTIEIQVFNPESGSRALITAANFTHVFMKGTPA